MPVYMYKVKDKSGKILNGEAKMPNQTELAALLSEKGFSLIEIKEKNFINDIGELPFLKARVKVKDLAIFCRQFAIIIEAGVPISNALDVIREQTVNRTLREALNEIYSNMQKGVSLSYSMKQFKGKIFPDILINMIEAGEVSGQLDKVFNRMAEHFERDFKLNQKVKGAMNYPIIVMLVAFGVIAILMTFVLPRFRDVLSGMNMELPLYTKIIMGVSNFMATYWWLTLGITIALVSFVVSFSRSYAGKRFIGSMVLKFPVTRNIMKNVISARFARTLSTLISSGVLLIESLEIVQKIIGNTVVQEKFDTLIEEVKKGKGLSQPIVNMDFFPPLIVSMIKVGEESGDLDYSLSKAADFYDQEVENSLQQMTMMLEPAIIIFLAVVVGSIVMAVLMPMFSLYQEMSK